MKFMFSEYTDVGRRRRNNEDRVTARLSDGRSVFAVSDGMGGHRSGDVAAERVLDTFVRETLAGRPLVDAARSANEAAVAIEGRVSVGSPGATLTALVFDADTATIVHAGDSAAWRLSASGVFEKLTQDDATVLGYITNYCGIGSDFYVRVTDVQVRQGDMFLVATDGLTKHVEETEIAAALRDWPAAKIARRLVMWANDRGGFDNTSAVAVEVLE